MDVTETAAKILIVGGVLLLGYAFITGYLLGRARQSSLEGPKYLILAHTEPLMQGTMMLGLVWAVQLSTLDAWLENVAASLLVAAASIQGLKELVNWRQGIQDEFQQRPRPLGYWAARTQAPLASAGLVILIVGVVRGL